MVRRRLSFLAAIALIAILVVATPRPHADIRLLTHEAGDMTPKKVQAALDLGVIVVDFLYTWTSRTLAR